MTTTVDDLEPLALRIWPNAKQIRISRDAVSVTAAAIDAHNSVIGQLTAESVDALREQLEHSLPQGGQAP